MNDEPVRAVEKTRADYDTCPDCGGQKTRVSALCVTCYRRRVEAPPGQQHQPSYQKFLVIKRAQANALRQERKIAGVCIKCGGPRDRETLRCSECQSKTSRRQKAGLQLSKALEVCTQCRKAPAEPGHRRCKSCGDRIRARGKYSNEATKAWRGRIRAETFAAYGGACACCGEKEPTFLEIDHVHNDGAEHRRQENFHGGLAIYVWLRKRGYPKDDFQLLCRNCNVSKVRNGGVCIHVTRRAEQVLETGT